MSPSTEAGSYCFGSSLVMELKPWTLWEVQLLNRLHKLPERGLFVHSDLSLGSGRKTKDLPTRDPQVVNRAEDHRIGKRAGIEGDPVVRLYRFVDKERKG